jgi:hypothetical protein
VDFKQTGCGRDSFGWKYRPVAGYYNGSNEGADFVRKWHFFSFLF